jgi:delta14-sterol reductase
LSGQQIVLGLLCPGGLYLLMFVLNLVLPARRIPGYLLDETTGAPVMYRLNGLLVLVLVLGSFLVGACMGWVTLDWLYLRRWSMLAGACIVGLAYTAALVLPAEPTGRGWLADLFLGRQANRTYFGRVDAKMYLYLAGAVLLALNALSFAWYHHLAFGAAANPGVYVQAALLLFFVLDYLIFERVHLYTYDIFAERLGFKLAWGCLVFYPFFYAVGLWGTVQLPAPAFFQGWGSLWLAGCTLVFLAGWVLARGANLQKYWFKRFPDRTFLGVFPPVAVTDGQSQLLVSGFWGLSRHVNYLGEVLMALGIAASLGHLDVPWPWLYPLYYVLLLVTRERDDDRRCAEKYGALWQEYRAAVPYRIIPGVY